MLYFLINLYTSTAFNLHIMQFSNLNIHIFVQIHKVNGSYFCWSTTTIFDLWTVSRTKVCFKRSQLTVSRTNVCFIRSRRQNPVPAKVIEINLERPHTALGNLGIVFLGANPVNCSSLHTTSPATFLDVNLKIWTLNIAGNMNTSQ